MKFLDLKMETDVVIDGTTFKMKQMGLTAQSTYLLLFGEMAKGGGTAEEKGQRLAQQMKERKDDFDALLKDHITGVTGFDSVDDAIASISSHGDYITIVNTLYERSRLDKEEIKN